jgi:hypothetical protein
MRIGWLANAGPFRNDIILSKLSSFTKPPNVHVRISMILLGNAMAAAVKKKQHPTYKISERDSNSGGNGTTPTSPPRLRLHMDTKVLYGPGVVRFSVLLACVEHERYFKKCFIHCILMQRMEKHVVIYRQTIDNLLVETHFGLIWPYLILKRFSRASVCSFVHSGESASMHDLNPISFLEMEVFSLILTMVI